jgi:hypothetical protein
MADILLHYVTFCVPASLGTLRVVNRGLDVYERTSDVGSV